MANDIILKHFDVVDSTNSYLRDNAEALWAEAGGRTVVAVTANHQTAGRGQRGNVWYSEQGANLLLSLMVRPGCALEVSGQFLLSQAVAVAIHTAMKCYGIETRLKWPNDIYVEGRKLAGVLVELDYSGAFVEQAVIGLGLNVNQTVFPEMDRVPVSMKMLLDKEIPIDDVLSDVLELFSYYYGEMLWGRKESIVSEYQELLLGFGEQCQFKDAGGCFTASIEGVEPSGNLLLKCTDGTLRRYAFKEVEQLI